MYTVSYTHLKHTRVEEIMDFAKKINAKKIGIATCVGLLKESRILADILDVYKRQLEKLAAEGVKYIGFRTIGYNSVDLEAAKRLGIRVAHSGYSPYRCV